MANRRRRILRSILRLDGRRRTVLPTLPLGILRLSIFPRHRRVRGAPERLRLSFARARIFLIDRGRRGGEPRGERLADSRRRRALGAARRLG